MGVMDNGVVLAVGLAGLVAAASAARAVGSRAAEGGTPACLGCGGSGETYEPTGWDDDGDPGPFECRICEGTGVRATHASRMLKEGCPSCESDDVQVQSVVITGARGARQAQAVVCQECGHSEELASRPATRGSSARSSRGFTLNDKARGEWLDNDEGLYNWWKRSRMSKREFIKKNRAEIDNAIYGVPGMGHFRR